MNEKLLVVVLAAVLLLLILAIRTSEGSFLFLAGLLAGFAIYMMGKELFALMRRRRS